MGIFLSPEKHLTIRLGGGRILFKTKASLSVLLKDAFAFFLK